jgi:P pilus assembly chaperone PapD
MKPFLANLLLVFVVATGAHAAAGGIGDLLVTPTRIVLDRHTRTAEIALINTGSAPTTYRIETQHLRMRPNGELVPAGDEPAGAFADALIQFSPHRLRLLPHLAQTVRLRLLPSAATPDGELYVHLLFHGEPPEEPAPALGETKELTIKVTPVYGVAIPVLVRVGESQASVRIDGVRVDGEAASFQILRSGNRSTHGNVVVTFTPRGGGAQQVGKARGVSVYAPLAARSMTMPLKIPPGVTLRDGVLQVAYVDAERGDANATTATLALP